jgi:Domain of unknown function (DU1801)
MTAAEASRQYALAVSQVFCSGEQTKVPTVSTDSSDKVATFMMELTHDRKPEVEQLRTAILALPLGLTEHIKWNAPSFCIDGDDRITFRLQPHDRVELIFHRGAKKRSDTATFTFTDPSGLMKLLAPDRGVVVLADATATAHHMPDILHLVEAWVSATKP